MYAWIVLIIAAVFEVIWAVAMKQSDGFTKLPATVIFVVASILSVVFLAQAMRTLPIGTSYAVWTGLGALGALAVGIIWLGDPASLARIFFAGVLLVGIIGIALTTPS